MTTDVKPDATPHTDCETLVANLKRQWNQGLIISIARPCMYIQLNHIIDFISSHRSVEVNLDELTIRRHGAVLDQAMKRCPSPGWRLKKRPWHRRTQTNVSLGDDTKYTR